MDKEKNRRKNYFIDKKFQRNFIIKFCLLVALGAFISGVMVYSMSRSTVTTTFENSRLKIKSTSDYILPSVMFSSLVVVVFVGLAAAAVTLFTSHRISGPLYRMQKDLEKIVDGNLKVRFNLREGDEIKALAKTLDIMTETMRLNVDKMKRMVDELVPLAADRKQLEKINKLKAILEKYDT